MWSLGSRYEIIGNLIRVARSHDHSWQAASEARLPSSARVYMDTITSLYEYGRLDFPRTHARSEIHVSNSYTEVGTTHVTSWEAS